MMTSDPDQALARRVHEAGGLLLVGLVAVAPWLFGCTTPPWRLVLALGLFSVIALWAARILLSRRLRFDLDPVSLCLLGLVLLTGAQLVPLPESVVAFLSPAAAEWHRTLLPADGELLPGESESDALHRSRWLPLSVAPAATEDLFALLLAAFLAYAAARNFAAYPSPRLALRRLAWFAFAAGVGLAALGLAQYLSGERSRVYWRIERESAVFGPFTNKNHFAFQMNLFAGLAGGLFVAVASKPGGSRSPAGLGLLAGLGLMAASVAFSQSRGGVIAALAACGFVGLVAWRRTPERQQGGVRAGAILAGGVAVVAAVLIAWLGWRGVADRFATLWGDNPDNRTADWRSVWPLAERFPLTGVGGGGLVWAEPTVRTRAWLGYEFNTLDNEYLEALVEGGVIRFLLTSGLALAAVWGAVAGFRRTGDPLLLGCAFSLAAVAFHAAGDFGMHTPSVALTAAVVAGFAGARRRETWDGRRESGVGSQETGEKGRLVGAGSSPARVSHLPAVAICLILVAGLVVVLVEWRSQRVASLRSAAARLLRSGESLQREKAIGYLEAATRIRPNDSRPWAELMFAELAAAAERGPTLGATVAGPAAFTVVPELPAGDPGGHVSAALRAARSGRLCQPLNPAFHLVLGTFADRFTRTEPAAVHFDRAKTVAGYDPEVWYAAGRAAALRGDWDAALADWHESLVRSPRRLDVIVRRAAKRLPPAGLRSRLLPDDPAVWLDATPLLFPREDDPARRDWLRATADRWASGPEPRDAAGLLDWAETLRELGDLPAAISACRRAVDHFPEETPPHDRLAQLLEADEQYEAALPLLEWLVDREPKRTEYRDRLDAAHHALKLKAEINGP